MRSVALLRTLGAPLAARDGSGDTALGPWLAFGRGFWGFLKLVTSGSDSGFLVVLEAFGFWIGGSSYFRGALHCRGPRLKDPPVNAKLLCVTKENFEFEGVAFSGSFF